MELRQSAIDAVHAQFGRPTGSWGRAAALLMAHRPSNRRRNSWAVSLLDAQRDDRVLELGFGPGLAIWELSCIAVEGYVCGIDHSNLMLRWARRRNAAGLRRGVVDLRLGSVDELPTDVTSAAKGREIAAALDQAGLSEVRLETMRLKPAVVCAVGVNGAGT
jgi:SAM-dependent methyltransferase